MILQGTQPPWKNNNKNEEEKKELVGEPKAKQGEDNFEYLGVVYNKACGIMVRDQDRI